jgi:ribosomal protein L40E
MVTSEEIKRRLEAKRRGVKPLSVGKESSSEANICPYCETENPPKAKFCVGCGEMLKEKISMNLTTETVENESTGEVTTPKKVPLSSKQSKYKICPECKQKNKLDAKFCVICGKQFQGGMLSSQSEEETVPKKLLSPSEEESKLPQKSEMDVASSKIETEKDTIEPVEKIRKAKELLDMGAITQEEFNQIKNKYLKQI